MAIPANKLANSLNRIKAKIKIKVKIHQKLILRYLESFFTLAL